MEDGLVQIMLDLKKKDALSLNPCCSGRWSRTFIAATILFFASIVLILVVVEDGLVL